MSDAPPLRIGIILDGWSVQQWVRDVLEDVVRSNFAQVELVVFNRMALREVEAIDPRETRPKALARILRTRSLRRKLLYSLYDRRDAATLPEGTSPFVPADCRDLLEHAQQLTVEPLFKTYVHRVRPEDVARIRAHDLDVVLRFGFNVLRGDVLRAARYGVWSFHHGDNTFIRGGPACFWEMRERHPFTGTMLQVLDDSIDAGFVLCKARFGTVFGNSVNHNRVSPYWGSRHFVIQKLWELHNHGWPWVREHAVAPEPYRGQRRMYTLPTNVEMAGWLAQDTLARIAVAPFGRRPTVRWSCAVRPAGPALPGQSPLAASSLRFVETRAGRNYRLPQLVRQGADTWLFVLDEPETGSGGRVSCGLLPANAGAVHLEPCEGTAHAIGGHQVIVHGEEHWLLAFDAGSQSIDLHRAERFPRRWTRVATIFEGCAPDFQLLQHEGRWWFLPTLLEATGSGAALLLLHSDRIEGPWSVHQATPLAVDDRFARGGGPVFQFEGRLVRPAQDRTPAHRSAVTFSEIVRLDVEGLVLGAIQSLARGREARGDTRYYSRAGGWEAFEIAR